MHRTLGVFVAALTLLTAAVVGVPAAPATPATRAAVAPLLTQPAGTDDTGLLRDAVRASRSQQRAVLTAARRAAVARAAGPARTATRPRPVTATDAGITAVWRALARCESGGDWHDTAGMFEGGVQFLNSTWLAYGGGRYATHAYNATPIEQVTIARLVLNRDGPSQWPVCGPRVHLQRGD